MIIFDLDGTLLNTIEDLGAATNHALEQMGWPTHELSSYPFYVGNGVRRLMERAMPDDKRSKENVDALLRHFRAYYDEHCCDNTRPYVGIPELLKELTARGQKLAVASNKYQKATSHLIQHFFPDVPWAAIEGQKEGVPVKPDPSIVFAILSQCPTPKSDVLYVGDSGVDMETARRACVTSIGVTWGFRPVKELRESLANHIISRPEDLLTLLP
ncbi:MAG: HAD family hydrolase [Bacteroidales bacterium]|nr:HAD family hydrolase [Bacteroidales bacterium]